MFDLLAQGAPSGGGFDFFQALGSIGVGALLAVPFVIVWRIAMKRIFDLEEEVKACHEGRLEDLRGNVAREKALSDSMAPLLQQAAEALRDTPQVLDKALERAQGKQARNESDLRIRQVELAMDALLRRKQPGEPT